ncbi:MAG: hypothetical protein H0U69_07165 [Trueperaceae bacterium]|nr:hypothetical protein [Trueperaceae bacterium]
MRVKAIIGVDCATQPHKIGLARATVTPDGWRVQDAMVCSASDLPEDRIAGWLEEEDATLLA